MSESGLDIWAQWILQRRSGGDAELMKLELANFLYPLRDKVLGNAKLDKGETLGQ